MRYTVKSARSNLDSYLNIDQDGIPYLDISPLGFHEEYKPIWNMFKALFNKMQKEGFIIEMEGDNKNHICIYPKSKKGRVFSSENGWKNVQIIEVEPRHKL